MTYHAPTPMRWVVGFVVRRLGEPLRSVYTAGRMRGLLAKYGFIVEKDNDIAAISGAVSPNADTRSRFTRHFRIATAAHE